jgi:2-oxoglutarate decarboxylase
MYKQSWSAIFGINEWLALEVNREHLAKKSSKIMEWDELAQVDGFSNASNSANPAFLEELFKKYLEEKHYLLANICPLESARKFFPKKLTHSEFFSRVKSQLNLFNLNETMLELINIFSKPYAILLNEQDAEKRQFLLNALFYRPVDIEAYKDSFLTKTLEGLLLEELLHKRYVGQKRFSGEGLEAFWGCLEVIKAIAESLGIKRLVLAMAHRGRLAVFRTLFRLPLSFFDDLFSQKLTQTSLMGDVKYHLGFQLRQEDFLMELLPNPSHLESINGVFAGYLKALKDLNENSMGVLVHGNASFCGQGITLETLNFHGLKGYLNSPVVHIILDNLVGFTTDPDQSTACEFASDVAKAFRIPVILVNALDFDAALRATVTAAKFSLKFEAPIILHLFGYRRWGHNEGDDPTVTQPLMYEEITKLEPRPRVYIKVWKAAQNFEENLLNSLKSSSEEAYSQTSFLPNFLPQPKPLDRLTAEKVKKIIDCYQSNLDAVAINPKIRKFHEERINTLKQGGSIDWGLAEILFFGECLLDEKPVRLAGQDSMRGTFSHRQAYLWPLDGSEPRSVLEGLGNLTIINTPLSEYGALAFEYGYSVANPNSVVIWEAQFGDFANGAQIIIDQYLSSAAEKWSQNSSIVLLLPHGYEGAGPEHSSARIERFLDLAANGNWTLAQPSTALSYFKILEQQFLKPGKPLVIFTPKSLLRFKSTFCSLSEILESEATDVIHLNNGAQSIVICSGKARFQIEPLMPKGFDILVLEQIYPLDDNKLSRILKPYKRFILFQEEPVNQGIYPFMLRYFLDHFGIRLEPVARRESASPATGYQQIHEKEQSKLLNDLSAIFS